MKEPSQENNSNFKNPELLNKLANYLNPYPEAVRFLDAYGRLCHIIDDLIDRDTEEYDRKGFSLMMLDTMSLFVDVYSSNFYQRNINWLYPVIKNIHRVYADSVAWENDKVKWKAEYADKLRCCGNEIILAILEHICGVNPTELREISLMIREDSFKRHHNEKGEAI